MNKMLRNFILCFFIAITIIIPVSIMAFDKNIGTISEGGSATYNGYDFFHFKQANNSKMAVICAKFKLFTPAASGISCTLSDWSKKEIKAGVAAIINKANISNSGMSKNYYYAELATNQFLYDYDGQDANNRISSNRNAKTILGNYYDYYEAAVNAYKKVKSGVSVSLAKTSGNTTWKVNADNNNNITNKYKVTCTNADSCTVKLTTTAPSGVKVYINNKETKEATVKSGDEISIKVSNLSESENFKINLTANGKMNYNVAARYSCGSYQPVTINKTESASISGSAAASFTVTTYDAPVYPNLKVIKKDANGNSLAGATIELALKNGNNYSKITNKSTNSSGEFTYDEINDGGEYCVVESKAPDGYLLDSTYHCFKVNVSENNTVTLTKSNSNDSNINISNNLVTITLVNQPNVLEISKVDANGNPLAGATLKLTNEKGETVVLNGETLEWVTTTSPKVIKALKAGIYYLYEVKAPNGYLLNVEPEVIEIDATSTKKMTIKMKDNENFVDISKVDIATKEELPGAHLQILDENGNVVVLKGEKLSWVSTDKPKTIKGLPAGTYYLQETLAPDKYKLMTEKIKFSIDQYGVVKVNDETSDDSVVIMTNEMTKVYISKKDIVSANELPGANIRILNSDGYIVEEWVSENEPHYIEGLPIGDYQIVETTTPDGYTLNSEAAKFTINEDGSITGDTVLYNNRKVDVPDTLLNNSKISTVIGLVLIATGIVIYIYMKKKNLNSVG